MKFEREFFTWKGEQMSLEYKVPRLLWESLESVLLANSKKYVCDLAKYLKVPEKELLKRVLPSNDSLKVYIQDSETNKCKAYIQKDALTVYCRKPVAYGCDYCSFHREKRMMVVEETNPTIIQRMKDRNELPPSWIIGTNIVDSNNNIIGKINHKNSTIKLFTISRV
jgi:hypothetical protein